MIDTKELEKKGYVWNKRKGGYVLDLKHKKNYILFDSKKEKYYIKNKRGSSICLECFGNNSVGKIDEIAEDYLLIKDKEGSYGNIFDIKNSKFVFPSPFYKLEWMDQESKFFHATFMDNGKFSHKICNINGEILYSSNKAFCGHKVLKSDDLFYVEPVDWNSDFSGYFLNTKTKEFTKIGVLGPNARSWFLDGRSDILCVYYVPLKINDPYHLYEIPSCKHIASFTGFTQWLDDKKTLLRCNNEYTKRDYFDESENLFHAIREHIPVYEDCFVLNAKTKKIVTPLSCTNVCLMNENLLDVTDRFSEFHGVVNANSGETILPCAYKKISINKENIIKAEKNRREVEYYTEEGKRIQIKSAKIEHTMEQ